MEDSKKAKFFCESCGAEVPASAKFCRKCGRFFAAVRCPKCSKVGSVSDFAKGCPRCHYAMTKEELYGVQDNETVFYEDDEKINSKSALKKAKKHSAAASSTISSLGEGIPGWLLIISLIVLVLLFITLFIRCNQ